MGKGAKVLYWAGAGAAFLVALLLALAVIVPRIVDSEWLKTTIRNEFANRFNGDLDFQKAELTILPSPAVSLQQVSLSIPDTAKVDLETLKVYPKLFPLLLGSIDLSKVVLDSPDFSLQLPEKLEKKPDQAKTFSFSDALVSASAKLIPILSAVPGLNLDVNQGSLRLFAKDKQLFLFENITGEFDVSSKSLTAAISCNSNVLASMELQATMVPGSKEGKGTISLENTRLKLLTDHFLQELPPLFGDSLTNLEVDFAINPKTGLSADIQSSGFSLEALHNDKRITANIQNLKGNFQYSDQISSLTVEDLSFSYPQVQLSGSFAFDKSAPHARLDIKSQKADIANVRQVLPVFINAVYGDLPVVKAIFDVIRGGTVSQAIFHVEGKSPADLAVFESMLINGHIENAEISLSALGLDLGEVAGDAAIAQGILDGKNLRARLGNSTGSDGTLKLGLLHNKTTPFHLDLDLNADLSQVPPLLKQLVPKKQVTESLSRFESIKGTGQGRLTLGESLESLAVRVEVNQISAQVNYKAIPYPVSFDSGRILFEGLTTKSSNLQGKIGRSTFSNYSSRMNFEGEPTIEVESGSFHIVLDEIFPWLASDKRLEDDLRDINNFTGIAEVTVQSVKGPLLQPAKLQYDLECRLKSVILTSTLLPGPLNIKAGKAKIVPDKIVFENLQSELLDSSLTYSGILQNFITGTTNAEIIVTNAEIDEALNTWLRRKIGIPPRFTFRTPLLISRLEAKWSREELLDLQGDFSIKNGPIFSVDVRHDSNELLLRNLLIQNDADRASITLDLEKRKIAAEFQGNLSTKTIDAILLHNDAFPDAWIKGHVKFHLDRHSVDRSSASGSLDGGDFSLPWKLDKPLLLDSFSLSAADKILTIHSAETVFEGQKYVLQGQASLSQELLAMNFDVRADTVELDKILGVLLDKNEEEAEKEKEERKVWDIAVGAQINLEADSLLYKNYTWKPFKSLITYENSTFDIEVVKAELCNISTPGKISSHDGQIALDFTLEAEGQEFNEVLTCLQGGKKRMTGIMNLKANISGQGTRDTLVNSLEGNLQYTSKDGYIYRDALLAKLLSLLDVTNLFQGKIPDLTTAGFHYDSYIVKGVMDKGIITIAPAKLEAPIMEITAHGTIDVPRERVNLLVLVAPLQTINKIQKMLPIIRKIIPTNLVGVPAEVKGDFSDIKVNPLSISAISKNVFDILVNALTTPVRVLEEMRQE